MGSTDVCLCCDTHNNGELRKIICGYTGTETVHRQDSSPTRISETDHRQNWRQFTDKFEGSSPTKKFCSMGFNEKKKKKNKKKTVRWF